MAPLLIELGNHPGLFDPFVTVTAQHREMLDQVLNAFSIKPDFDLNLMHSRQSLSDINAGALAGIDSIIKKTKPDLILVHGDTTTTLAAALAAFYNGVKIGHVEAGLRTYDKNSPFPEEMNRQITGLLADLHFAPTQTAVDHLLEENKDPQTIFLTGNTGIDALTRTVSENYRHELLDSLINKKLILVTAHRRENIGGPMRHMFRAIRRLSDDFPETAIVYPVHLNPVIMELADKMLGGHPRIHLIKPLDVIGFHNFAAKSFLIMTDSGGIQEEASYLGVPVLVMRDTTERPEGIEAEVLKLAGTEEERIYSLARELLTNEAMYKKMASPSHVYGDGNASKRIIAAIIEHFRLASDHDSPVSSG